MSINKYVRLIKYVPISRWSNSASRTRIRIRGSGFQGNEGWIDVRVCFFDVISGRTLIIGFFEVVSGWLAYRTIEMCIFERFFEIFGAVTKEKFWVFYGLGLVFHAFFPIGCSYVTSDWSSWQLHINSCYHIHRSLTLIIALLPTISRVRGEFKYKQLPRSGFRPNFKDSSGGLIIRIIISSKFQIYTSGLCQKNQIPPIIN